MQDIAHEQAARQFRGSPMAFQDAFPDLAPRASFTMRHGESSTTYVYHVHRDRTAMHAYVNKHDNMTRPVVPVR